MSLPLNSHAPAPLQACCLSMAASARPASFQPAPDLKEAMAAFVQAAGVLARACRMSLQRLPGDSIQTSPHAPLVLPRSSHSTLVCEKGTVWITQGDGNDYVLTAGQRLTLAPKDQVIVKAMHGPAWVRCLGA